MTWRSNLLFTGCLSIAFINPLQSAEIGQVAPVCELTQLNSDSSFNLHSFKGNVLYLDFWASWCPPCAKSFPFLNQLHQQYRAKGLKIIGINLDESIEEANNFLTRYPAHFAIAVDASKQCAKQLGVAAMPSSYLIDRQGVIRQIQLGFRAGETTEIRQKIEQLLSE